MVQILGSLPFTKQTEFQAPGFHLAQPWLLEALREEASELLGLYLCVHVPTFQIKFKYFLNKTYKPMVLVSSPQSNY